MKILETCQNIREKAPKIKYFEPACGKIRLSFRCSDHININFEAQKCRNKIRKSVNSMGLDVFVRMLRTSSQEKEVEG